MNLPIWLLSVVEDAGNYSDIPNTSNDCSSLFGPIVSFIALMTIQSFELISRLVFVSLNKLNFVLRLW